MRLALALALIVLTPACGPAAGGSPPVEAPTIVSLNPCTDAILTEVARPWQIAALSHYSHDPRATSMELATARRFPATGGTVEEVLALDPDIVLASSFMAPATRNALADLGIRVETFGIASSVADSHRQVRAIARIAGAPAEGEALVERIDAGLARAAPPPGSAPVPTVLWQPGGIVPGEDALASELMARAGLASHSAARGMSQADYLALERLLTDSPRLLLIAGGGPAQRHAALNEVPEMHRARFDPSLLYCGGPTIIRAAERLAQVRRSLHGSGLRP